jgi:putative (di)nucleoside polyphosphate hydrolase
MKEAIVTCGIYLYSIPLKKILVCHATNSPWNRWSIPKGLQDKKEKLYDAAIRELYEETGVALKELTIAGKHELEAVKYQKQNKLLHSFLVLTDADLSQHTFICHSLTERSFPEVDSWKWITVEQAEKWLHEAQQKNLPRIQELIASHT